MIVNEFSSFRECREKMNRLMCSFIKNAQSSESQALNLNSTQVHVVLLLRKFKVLKMSDLTKHINVVKSSITNIIDSLEKLNLVKRSRDENDRRIIFVSLSNKGIELSESLRGAVFNSFNNSLKALNADDKEKFALSLEIIDEYLDKMEKMNG
ncbi:MAG: MarR family transcriptional regulator [Pleomorphochaeta sp.]